MIGRRSGCAHDVVEAILPECRALIGTAMGFDDWRRARQAVVIGLHASSRHDADMVAGALVSAVDAIGERAVRRGMGDEIKRMCAVAVGIPADTPWFWGSDAERMAPRAELGGMSGRAFLHAVGTEGVRSRLGDDAWIRIWCAKVLRGVPPAARIVIVPDIRIAAEAAFVRPIGLAVKIIACGTDARADRRRIDDAAFDQVRTIAGAACTGACATAILPAILRRRITMAAS